ncbi:MAG TPA: Hsp20/alpha crystallin family protein [Candidatus Baltobacteraceae bacterium]|nr:Hsp20/alpha crystallin family protein [Candidatus Baltobacteraceae bacterium]
MDYQELVRRPHSARWEPNADLVIEEAARRVVVRVEAAGVDPESLRAHVDDRFLFITGRRADTMRWRDGSLLQKEISDGEFLKKLYLPAAVQFEDVTATYQDGMLTIVLPVSASAFIPLAHTEIRVVVKRVVI